MDVIYNLTGFATLLLIGIAVAGLIKPSLLKRYLKKFAIRRYITIGSFALLLVFGSILSATEPDSVKQARLDKERASKEAALIKKTNEEKQKAAEEEAKKKAEPKVEKKELKETQKIAFAKEQQQDASLAIGTSTLKQTGKDGQKTLYYEVTYTDGKETSRTLKSEIVDMQPTHEITLLGTYTPPAASAPAPRSSPSSTPPAQSPSGTRTGAICKDGWRSTATGRGACSHHGGVATWLYD